MVKKLFLISLRITLLIKSHFLLKKHLFSHMSHLIIASHYVLFLDKSRFIKSKPLSHKKTEQTEKNSILNGIESDSFCSG